MIFGVLKDIKEGENLFYSPNGEPVLIVQSGRDGEYIGTPIIKFKEDINISNTQNSMESLSQTAQTSLLQ